MGQVAVFFGFFAFVFTMFWLVTFPSESAMDKKNPDALDRLMFKRHRMFLWSARVAWGLCAVCTVIYLLASIAG